MKTHFKTLCKKISQPWWLILLLIFFQSCSESHTRSLKFQVTNNSTSKINIHWRDLTSAYNYDVTITTFAHPGENRIVVEHLMSSAYYNDDWAYWHNGFYIDAITNMSGDTINFDPNVANLWDFIDEDPNSYYTLNIDSTSF